MKHKGEYFGGGNFNDDPWTPSKPSDCQWWVWKSYREYCFDERDACCMKMFFSNQGHTKDDAEAYIAANEREDQEETWWIDTQEKEY